MRRVGHPPATSTDKSKPKSKVKNVENPGVKSTPGAPISLRSAGGDVGGVGGEGGGNGAAGCGGSAAGFDAQALDLLV